MRRKKITSVLLLMGMLTASVATSAFAATGGLTGARVGNDYSAILSNYSNTDRASLLHLNNYDRNWGSARTFASKSKTLGKSGSGNNASSVTGTSTAAHVKAFGTIYKGNVAQSGVDYSASKTLK